jgi:hypothetical protein
MFAFLNTWPSSCRDSKVRNGGLAAALALTVCDLVRSAERIVAHRRIYARPCLAQLRRSPACVRIAVVIDSLAAAARAVAALTARRTADLALRAL